MKVEIGKRLKSLRMGKGLTQKELAARVSGGLDYTYIGKIERGEQLPSLKILLKISEALSVSVNHFFQDDAAPVLVGIPFADLKRLVKAKKGSELLRALKLLHEDDIPLMVEIIHVLSRHRKALTRTTEEQVPMAAEEGAPYGKK
ncbi:MAG: XRE family transcriptional [Geobacteraceae bacterium]|nr:MAG: XRE family transcriptional [Geobacteraceae bacterium]